MFLFQMSRVEREKSNPIPQFLKGECLDGQVVALDEPLMMAR
jgi:hypothetical protein